jgi:class 3 adenylate cyclase
MNKFEPNYDYYIDQEKGILVKINDNLHKFNVDLLNIGDLKRPSKSIEVISIFFDLEGFTNFTKQVDPQLSIPNFISDFFNWLFDNIKKEITQNNGENILWAELPFFCKFMGDGALFLWRIDLDKISLVDSKLTSEELQENLQRYLCNIVATMHDICNNYRKFYKELKNEYTDLPQRLRCGIARGNVFPIGNGLDFVGPCINISARLQKFSGLSFAFSARGIDEIGFNEGYKKFFVKKRVAIHGIGDNELIYILEKEFIKLSDPLKLKFADT